MGLVREACAQCLLLLSRVACHASSRVFFTFKFISDFTKRSGLPPKNSACVVSTSGTVFASRLCPNFARRRRRRLAAEDSPVSDASGADLDGADTLLDTVDTPGHAGGAGAGHDAGNDGGNSPVHEDEEEDDGDVSDPPPMEYNADRDREIDEDPDHSDGGDDAGAGEEVRACVRGCVRDDCSVKIRSRCSRESHERIRRRVGKKVVPHSRAPVRVAS